MRATTAFNKLLALNATFVQAVNFDPSQISVTVRLPAGGSGVRTATTRRCRSMTGAPTVEVATPRRVRPTADPGLFAAPARCPTHGVTTEQVPFARPGARVTHDFENLVVWCVTSMDRTAATVLCRVAWRTVNAIIERVVPSTPDLTRIEGLVHIGVDEISWKRGHKYLTLVVDHDTGDVIWGAKDRTAATLEEFFEQLGPDKTAELEAISMDFGAPYAKAARESTERCDLSRPVPHGRDGHQSPRRNPPRSRQRDERIDPDAAKARPPAGCSSTTPRTSPTPKPPSSAKSNAVGGGSGVPTSSEALRTIYSDHTLGFDDSRWLLDKWISRALRSQLPAVIRLAKTLRSRFEEVTNAWFYGITNARNEGTHSAIRTIFARAHGFHTAEAALSTINLVCGPTPIPGPHPSTAQAA